MRQYMPGIEGCTDGSCIFQDNSGRMVTNGGCSCMRELQRSEEGFKAVRTILFLRREMKNLNTYGDPWEAMPDFPVAPMGDSCQMPQGHPSHCGCTIPVGECLTPKVMSNVTSKVRMIKEVREAVGCGLKEAKEAVDRFNDIELAILYLRMS